MKSTVFLLVLTFALCAADHGEEHVSVGGGDHVDHGTEEIVIEVDGDVSSKEIQQILDELDAADLLRKKFDDGNSTLEFEFIEDEDGSFDLKFGDGGEIDFYIYDDDRKDDGYDEDCIKVGVDKKDNHSLVIRSECEYIKAGFLLTDKGIFSFSNNSKKLSEMKNKHLVSGGADSVAARPRSPRPAVRTRRAEDPDALYPDDNPAQADQNPDAGFDENYDTTSQAQTTLPPTTQSQATLAPATGEKYLDVKHYVDHAYWQDFLATYGTEEAAEKATKESIQLFVTVARQLYLRDSLKPKTNLRWTHFEIYKNGNPEGLVPPKTADADKDFGTYVDVWNNFIAKRGDKPDMAVLWTGVFKGRKTTTLGIAPLSGACGFQPGMVVAGEVPNNQYLHQGYTLAHEMGHNLGMQHDSGACDKYYVMTAADNGTPVTDWSPCSNQQYQKFIKEMIEYNTNCLDS